MTTLQEGELRLTLPETANGRKFDGPAHGLSHCMKAVDWIIELPDRVYFVEVKDPTRKTPPPVRKGRSTSKTCSPVVWTMY